MNKVMGSALEAVADIHRHVVEMARVAKKGRRVSGSAWRSGR